MSKWLDGIAGDGCNFIGDGQVVQGAVRCNPRGIHFEGTKDSRFDFTIGWDEIARLEEKGGAVPRVILWPTGDSNFTQEGLHSADLGVYGPSVRGCILGCWDIVREQRRWPTQEEFDAIKAAASASSKQGCLGAGIALLALGVVSSYWAFDKLIT